MILSFIIGLVVAGAGAVIALRKYKASVAQTLQDALANAALQAEAEKKAAVARLEADLQNTKEQLTCQKEQLQEQSRKLLEAKEQAHQQTMQELDKRHNQAIEAEKKRLQDAIEVLKADVKNTTSEMLRERQKELQQSNDTNMQQIVKPLKESIQKMETALQENKTTQETSTATIKENIATLVSTTMRVNDSAERLSNALTAESKTQGCWGEQKIEALLQAIGLEKGLEYDAQEYLRDAAGNIIVADETERRMQPDIILHLDEKRDLIIDSKVSLTAYVDYMNAETEEGKNIALTAHLKSIRAHVKELAKKNYAAYIKHPRQSVDFVMMFVPVNSALQLALDADHALWREAMNQGVFIVGEQNLYAALRAVQVTWTTIKQNANNKAICDTAEELMGRVGDMLARIEDMGKKLEKVNEAYRSVMDKSMMGRQNVLGSAKKLVKLGAKVSNKYPLPQWDAEEENELD